MSIVNLENLENLIPRYYQGYITNGEFCGLLTEYLVENPNMFNDILNYLDKDLDLLRVFEKWICNFTPDTYILIHDQIVNITPELFDIIQKWKIKK